MLRKEMEDFKSTLVTPTSGSGSAEEVINKRLADLLSRIDTDSVETITPHFEALKTINTFKNVSVKSYKQERSNGEWYQDGDADNLSIYATDAFTDTINAFAELVTDPSKEIEFQLYPKLVLVYGEKVYDYTSEKGFDERSA